MGYTDDEMITMLMNTSGIHHLPKDDFTDIIRKRPYDQIKNKKTVFLDLKYWISFRMILGEENTLKMGSEQITLYKRIYKKLQELTESGKISCVISDSILSELEKMALNRRLETAKIMENLKTIIVLNGINACTFEYINMDLIASGKLPFEDYHLSSVFEANRFVTARDLAPLRVEQDVIHNIMYDAMSQMTITEYLKENDGERYDTSEMFAKMFNEWNLTDETENTFEQLLIQGLESQQKSLRELIKFQPTSDVNPADHLSSYQKHAPYLYLHAAIHAAMHLEKARKIHSNDFFDLSHSCMGVGYADYFFTEKKFHHLLRSKPIDCTAVYKCSIHSDPSEIVDILEQF
jgi:hypothetical protein